MRNDAREAAFKVVFSRLLGGDCPKGVRTALYEQAKLDEEERAFAERLISVVEERCEHLSAVIAEKVTGYSEDRIYTADKAILLLALAEIEYFDEIPPVVSVSEATALARKYSAEKSTDFVNGVLGGVINA